MPYFQLRECARVEAMRFNGANARAVGAWVNQIIVTQGALAVAYETLLLASEGDWIVRKGFILTRMSDEDFRFAYEPAPDES